MSCACTSPPRDAADALQGAIVDYVVRTARRATDGRRVAPAEGLAEHVHAYLARKGYSLDGTAPALSTTSASPRALHPSSPESRR